MLSVLVLLALVISGAGDGIPLPGARDQALTSLFAPVAAPPGTYDVYTSAEPVQVLASRLRTQDPSPRADAWKVLGSDPVNAFGVEGRYDRARLARLFVGRRVQVARGSLRGPDGVVGYTLVSPYPDPSLETLRPGTMIIVARIGKLLDRDRSPSRASIQEQHARTRVDHETTKP
jgi:hypothetical protein